jgi:hypothetical protein
MLKRPTDRVLIACVLSRLPATPGEATTYSTINTTKRKAGNGMPYAEDLLAQEFVCARCHQKGAQVERLAMLGTGISRLFEALPVRLCVLHQLRLH